MTATAATCCASSGPTGPPAALFTGTEPADEVDGLAEAVIPKPFEIGLLRSTVDRLVSERRAAGRFRPVTATGVYTPLDFEQRLKQFLFESSEEGRAVRVGEKETSEQAEIVARYADLFTRDQLEALHEAESAAQGDEPRAALPAAQGLRGRNRLRRAGRARGRAGEPPARRRG